ncbi:MAG: SIR2 family protein [Bacteroidota bacterium]
MPTTPIQWDFIIDKILQEQCVLILGPEVNLMPDSSITCQEALLNYLDVENSDIFTRYYPDDEFFLFDEPYKRTLACHKIKSFYENIVPNGMLSKLVQIPFHIYLSVSPDQLLQKAFTAREFNYQSGYYKKNKLPQDISSPRKENPLVYNVFGSILSEESIILTHDDLYDYFKSIFAQRSMPEKLKIELRNVKNFIFLGIPFDKWYMQLLLRELEIHNRNYEFIRYAANQSINPSLQTYCHEQFRISFISNNLPQFIDALYDRFTQEQLRQATSTESSLIQKAQTLIANGQLSEAIDIAEDLLEGTPLQDDITHLAGRYRRFRKKTEKGMLSSAEQSIQESLISDSLQQLLNEAQDLD